MLLRRLILLMALALLPAWAGAQSVNGAFIQYTPAALPLTGGTLTGPLVLPAGSAGIAAAPYVNRQYDAVVVVSTTITAALAAITDASYAKRYLLYVPDGTYNAEGAAVQAKSYVDIVGQSRTGTILTTAGAYDAIKIGGKSMMLANMTISNTNADYAIHVDDAASPTDTPLTIPGVAFASSTTIVYNVTATAAGKHAIGIGLRMSQRLVLIDSSFSAPLVSTWAGVYMHNTATMGAPCEMTLLNVTASGQYGLSVNPTGSGQSDLVMVSGGRLIGAVKDVRTYNSGAGASEIYVSLSPSTVYATTDFVSAAKVISLPAAVASLPVAYQSRYRDYLQEINQVAGLNFSPTGVLTKTYLDIMPSIATTAQTYFWAHNAGGSLKAGVEAVAGNSLFTGGSSYAGAIGTFGNTPFEVFSNNVKRAAFPTTGGLSIADVLFANLGAPANGTITYCSDCTLASPCAAGGTGALAKRLNNAWVCN